MEDELLDFTKLRYVLYARKSTVDESRQIRSTSDQIAECRQLAARLGLTIVEPPIIEEKSAKRPNNRPLFRQMLNNIRAGKYDGILAWNPDRLARNMLEGGEIIDMIDEEIIKDLKFVTHHFTKDANGKMLLGMAFVLSKQYSDKLSQDVTRGVRRRLTQEGKTPTPKHGYTNEAGSYLPDGDNHNLICEAFSRRRQGEAIESIVDYLRKSGYFRTVKSSGRRIGMTKQILSEIFRDSFYYGVLVQANQKVDLRELYDFVPAVSEEDFFEIQRWAYQKHRMKPSKPHTNAFYPLRMMVFCSFCNESMRVAPSKGNTKKYLYYRCDNKRCLRKKRSVRAKVIFDFIYQLLEGGLNLTEKEYHEYYDNLSKLTDENRQKIRAQLNTHQGVLKRVQGEAKERSLQILKLDPQSRIYRENAERVSELEDEEVELQKEIAKLEKQIRTPEDDKLTLEQFLNLSKNGGVIVQSADERIKDIICRRIFLNFFVDEEKVASYQLKEPFDTLLKQREFLSSRGGET